MISTTFPLSEDIFMKLDEIDQSDYSVDVSKISFEDDIDENIESTFIYIRNLQLTMCLDFSNVDYETKEKWLLKYLTFNLITNPIKDLDETILTILANDYIGFDCILTQEEIKRFRENNNELVDEIINFYVSLDTIADILIKNQGNEQIEYKIEELNIEAATVGKPEFYECAIHLINDYPNHVDGIRLFYNREVKQRFYKYVIDDIQGSFDTYSAILKLPSIRFFEIIFVE